MLSEPFLFYLRPIVFCAIILCREDPNFIPSVTFLTGARALLEVPSSHLFSRQNLPCSFSFSLQVWCSRPQSILKPSAEICLSSLLYLLYLWVEFVYSGCGLMSTVEGSCPFSLLATVLLTSPGNRWPLLMFSSIRTNTFHWLLPRKVQPVLCIPSQVQDRAFVLAEFQAVPNFCLKTGARFAFCQFFGVCPSPFKGAPCKSEQPWMHPARCHGHLWVEVSDTRVSPLPPTLPLSAEAWRTFLVKTGLKKAWSTSVLTCVHGH